MGEDHYVYYNVILFMAACMYIMEKNGGGRVVEN